MDRNMVPVNNSNSDCMRRFLPKIGPLFNAEYNIYISDLIIKDLGNIHEHLNEEQSIEALKTKL